MPEFETVEEAYEWMEAEVDDPCIDNHRVCYLDDPESIGVFEEMESNGCCGSSNYDVVIQGRHARIGCNYGH
jgi:hypothetical protein